MPDEIVLEFERALHYHHVCYETDNDYVLPGPFETCMHLPGINN